MKRKRFALILMALCFVLAASFGCAYVYAEEKYVVTFRSGADVLATEEYKVGAEVTFPEDPQKESDEEYDYVFLGWNYSGLETDELIDSHTVLEDVTIYAVYEAVPIPRDDRVSYLVTFRDGITNRIISFTDPDTGELVTQQHVGEGDIAKYPAEAEIPDHTDIHRVFSDWSEPQGTIITARTEIYANYKYQEFPVHLHVLQKDYLAEMPVEYESYLELPKDISGVGDPDLTPSVFSVDGWYWDEGLTQKIDSVPKVDEELLDAHAEKGEFHVYAACSLKNDAGYIDVSTNANYTYGSEITARVRDLSSARGLSYAYSWNVKRNGKLLTADSETFRLRDAGNYEIACNVTITYGDNIISAVRELAYTATVTVEKANLVPTLTLSRTNLIYGEEAPVITAEYEGFRFDDTASVVKPNYTYYNDSRAQSFSASRLPAGSYTLTASYDEMENYTITLPDALHFTVGKKSLTLTLSVADTVYGEKFAPVLGGFGDMEYAEEAAILGDPVYTVNGTARKVGEILPARSGYRVTVSGLSSDDYTINYPATVTFNVAKRPFNVVTEATGCTYGESPVYGFRIVYPDLADEDVLAFLKGEEVSVFSPTYNLLRGGSVYSHNGGGYFLQGDYTVTANLNKNYDNYVIGTTDSATFKVAKRPLTLGIELRKGDAALGADETYTYGDRVQAVVTYEGFAVGEDETMPSVITVPSDPWNFFKGDSPYNAGTFTAGAYTVAFGKEFRADNYEITYSKESAFTVAKKDLKLTLALATDDLIYGDTPAAKSGATSTSIGGITFDGLANGETPRNFENGKYPTMTFLKVEADGTRGDPAGYHAGNYVATVTFEAANYNIIVEEHPFEIAKRTVEVSIKFNFENFIYGSKFTYTLTYGSDRKGFVTKADETAYTKDAYLSYVSERATYTQQMNGEIVDKEGKEAYLAVDSYTVTVTGFGELQDYTVQSVGQTKVTIEPKDVTLSVTADKERYTYGDTPVFTPTMSGFVAGESAENLPGGAPVLAYQKEDAEYVLGTRFGAGNYVVTFKNPTSGEIYRSGDYGNYRVRLTTDSYTVAKKALTVTTAFTGFTYGDYTAETIAPAYSYNGFIGDEDEDVLGGTHVLTYTFRKGTSGAYDPYEAKGLFRAGYYCVTVSGLTSENYEITYNTPTFTVAKKSVTVGVENVEDSYIYGQKPAPILTFEGFVAGESEKTEGIFSARPAQDFTYTGKDVTRFAAGSYTVLATSGYTADNYTFSYDSRIAFTVEKAALKVTVSAEGFVYGGTPAPTLRYEGFVYEETATNLEGTPQYTYDATGLLHVGEHTVSVKGYSSDDYDITYVGGTFTVTKKDLKIEVAVDSFTYGDKQPEAKVTYVGFIKGESEANLTNELVITYTGAKFKDETKNGHLHADTYTVTLSGCTSEDYAITFGTATFTVAQKELTFTVAVENFTYGDDKMPVVTHTDFAYDEDKRDLTGELAYTYTSENYHYTGAADGHFHADTYTVSISGYTSEDYDIKYVEGTFTVEKKALTIAVTVDGDTFGYGAAVQPEPEVTYVGFIDDEDEHDLTGELILTDSGEKKDDRYRAGKHTLSLTESTYASNDYAITYDGDSFTVTPRTVDVALAEGWTTYADDPATWTEAYSWYTLSGDSILEGELPFTYSLKKGAAAYKEGTDKYFPVGTYTLTVTYTPDTDYVVKQGETEKEGTLTMSFTVAKRSITLTVSGGTQTPWANREAWSATPTIPGTISAKGFTLEGTIVLKDAAEKEAGVYEDTTIGSKFAWKDDFKILLDGKDVKENFEVGYSLHISLSDSSFSVTVPQNTTETYNKEKHTVAVKATADGVAPEDIKYEYSLTKEGVYSTEFPEIVNAGTYTVYYKVSAENCKDATGEFVITIDPKPITVKAPSFAAQTYKAEAYNYKFTVADIFPGLVEADAAFAKVTLKVDSGSDESGSEVTVTEINAGAYNVTYSLVFDDGHADLAKNYKIVYGAGEAKEGTVTITINKARLTKPTEDTTTFTYNKGQQTYDPKGFKSETMTIDGNTRTVAGSQQVTVSIIDKTNYEWTDATQEDIEFTFVINKAQLTKPTAVTESFTYNKAEQKFELHNFDSDTMQVANNTRTAAGSQQVTVSIIDTDNYEWTDATQDAVTFDFIILKKVVEVPTIASKTYNAKAQTAEVAKAADTEYTVTTNDGGTDAGDYNVILTLADPANYRWADAPEAEEIADKTLIFKIEKAQATIEINAKTYTYTGELQTVKEGATAKGLDGDTNGGLGTITYSNNTFTTVAEGNALKVTVTLSEGKNYLGTSTTFTITVNKAEATINTDGITKEYTYNAGIQYVNKGAVAVGVNGDTNGLGTITYSDNMSFTTVAEGNALQITVTLSEGTNYFGTETTFTIKVNKAEATIVTDGITKEYTYTGAEQTVTGATAKGLGSDTNGLGAEITYLNNTFIDRPADGKQIVTVKLKEGDNYLGAETTFEITINRATGVIENVEEVTTTYTYNGTQQSVDLSGITANFGAETLKFSVDKKENTAKLEGKAYSFTNVNDANGATITVTLPETDNYTGTSTTFTITVNKADVEIDITKVETNYTYNGQAQYATGARLKFVGGGFVDGVFPTSSSNTDVPDEGVHQWRFELTFSGDDNLNAATKTSIDVTVNPRKVVITNPADITTTYDGNPHAIAESEIKALEGDENSGLAAGHTLGEIKFAKGSSATNVADSGTFTFTVKIMADGTDVTKNYDIVYGADSSAAAEEGSFTITINQRSIRVKKPDHTEVSYGDDIFGVPAVENVAEGDTLTVKYSYDKGSTYDSAKVPSNTDLSLRSVGGHDIYVIVEIKRNSDGGDVLDNYDVTYDMSEDSSHKPYYTLTIEKIQLTVQWNTELLSVDYQIGKSYKPADFVLSYGDWGFAYGEGISAITVKFENDHATIENAGKYKVILSASNYTFNEEEKEIEIKKATFNELPGGVTAPKIGEQINKLGKTLQDVKIDNEKVHWNEPNTPLELGSNAYAAVYEDTNYIVNFTITFETTREEVTIDSITGALEANFGAAKEDFKVGFTAKGQAAARGDDTLLSPDELALITANVISEINVNLGSTYFATVKFTTTTDNKYFKLTGETEFKRVAKLRSVQIGNAWYTIEEALHAATSGQTITVKNNTSFAESAVAEKAGYTVVDGYYTVKSGVTLLVPYAEENEGTDTGAMDYNESYASGTTPTNYNNKRQYVVLTIADGVTLFNNGTLTLGAIVGAANTGLIQGAISGGYAEITLNGVIKNYNTINAYGNINGTGKIWSYNGATIRERLEIKDWRGGTIAASVFLPHNTTISAFSLLGSDYEPNSGHLFPFKQYSVNSISTDFVMEYGAIWNGVVRIWTDDIENPIGGGVAVSARFTTVDFVLASKAGDKQGLFQLNPGSNLTKHTENGRVKITVSGGAIGGQANLEVSAGANFILKSGIVAFPIDGTIDIELQDGIYSSAYGYRLLPGSTLKISRGPLNRETKLTLSNTDKGYLVYSKNDIVYADNPSNPSASTNGKWEIYPEGRGDAQLIVGADCTLEIIGKFAGNIFGEDNAMLLIQNSAALSNTIEEGYGSKARSGLNYTFTFNSTTSKNIIAMAVNGDATSQQLSAGTWYYKNNKWISPSTKFEIHYNYRLRTTTSTGEKQIYDLAESVDTPENWITTYTSGELVSLVTPSCGEYTFIGWYLDERCTRPIESFTGAEYLDGITLYGLFEEVPADQKITIHYSIPNYLDNTSSGFEVADKTVLVDKIGEFKPDETVVTSKDYDVDTKYYFGGWYIDDKYQTEFSTAWLQDQKGGTIVTLYAKWAEKVKLQVTVTGKAEITLTADNIDGLPSSQSELSNKYYYLKPGTEVTFDIKFTISVESASSRWNTQNGHWEYSITNATQVSGDALTDKADLTDGATIQKHGVIAMPNSNVVVEITASGKDVLQYQSSCIVEGTLITLADGTQKPIEDLVMGVDEILTFDHFTGRLTATSAYLLIYREAAEVPTVKLHFSNGTTVHVVEAHGFFDVGTNQYEIISVENVAQYVGHRFFSIDGGRDKFTNEIVELVSYELSTEYIECYSLFTSLYVDHVANGMLAVTDGGEGLYNFFELDENMKYDEAKMQADIEKYGLFTYEEFAEYLTKEEFDMFNVQYLKVALGKGLVTMDRIYHYFDVVAQYR